ARCNRLERSEECGRLGLVRQDLLLLSSELLAAGLLVEILLIRFLRCLRLGELRLERRLPLPCAPDLGLEIDVEHDEIERSKEAQEEHRDAGLRDRRQPIERGGRGRLRHLRSHQYLTFSWREKLTRSSFVF